MKKISRKHDTLFNRIKDKYRKPITLTGRHYKTACRMLTDTTKILNENNINYFFDAGGLLGLMRDGDLIPWDNDLDMLLPSDEFNKFTSIIPELKKKNWRVYTYTMEADGPGWKKGDAKGIKLFNHFFLKFGRGRIVMDITVIYRKDESCYRKAMGRTWELPARHFKRFDTFNFKNQSIKIPVETEEYLSYVYGDWRKPKQDYDPLEDDQSMYKG